MTTKIDADGARLVPALGETWGHLPTNRIILSVSGNEHRAYLFKSASLPDAFARFQILVRKSIYLYRF
jgi:RAD51-like protein 2